MGAVLFWAALAAAAPPGEPLSPSHRAPYESLAGRGPAAGERQETLAEMWQRGILPSDARNWGPEDLLLLARVRDAEAAGAIELLRRRGAGSAGLVASVRRPGDIVPRSRLTRAGYERYRLLRTQDALAYFERKGIETKWAFRLRDMEGRPLFDADGRLSEAGETVFRKALANLPVHWQDGYGTVYGTRAPPSRAPASPAARSFTPKAGSELVEPPDAGGRRAPEPDPGTEL